MCEGGVMGEVRRGEGEVREERGDGEVRGEGEVMER